MSKSIFKYMSKKTPSKESRKFFNINREAKKHYPKGSTESSQDSCIPVFAEIRSLKHGHMTGSPHVVRFAQMF